MKILCGFKFELYVDKPLRAALSRNAGCRRFVFNKALALQNERRKAGEKLLTYNELAAKLVVWKKAEETSFLKEAMSQPLQQTLRDLDRAIKDSFRPKDDPARKQWPKFKARDAGDGFRIPQFKASDIDDANGRVKLPKIGWVRYRNSRDIVGEIKNVTVSQKCGHYFVSIQTEFEYEIPTHKGGEIGIDMGVARFATLSNGEFFEPLNAFKTYKGKLAKLQRQLKNKVKFSQNWQKLKAKIAKLHHKIANCRKDFLHQTSSKISKNHAMIYIEDLQVSNMSKSAKGTAETPGKNVAAKSGLNQAILDQSWFEFRRQLDYKTQWQGGFLVAVPAQNTSRTCPCCGHVAKENRQTQANFECVECGYTENADVVGALNVLGRGRAIVHA